MRKLLLTLLALSLSACASIPTASDPQVANPAPPRSVTDQVRSVLKPPTSSMSAEQIVQGFIEANAEPARSYPVARQYLDDTVMQSWHPDTITLYDPTTLAFTPVSESLITVTFTTLGSLGPNYRLELLDVSTQSSVLISVAKTSAGWRITNPAATAYLSVADFQRNYQASALWFMSPDYRRLVPDVVWLPAVTATRATRLMNLLLKGPSGVLATATRTAIPAETELSLAAVTVDSGVTEVALTKTALEAVGPQRTAMLAQIVNTLARVGGSVEIRAGGQILSTGGRGQLRSSDFTELNPDNSALTNPLFIASADKVGRWAPSGFDPIFSATSPTNLAVSRDGARIAVATANLLTVYSAVDGALFARLPRNVVDLDFDTQDRLWIAEVSGRVHLLNVDGELNEVAGVPKSEWVRSLAISPDGVRVAISSTTGLGSALRVYPIIDSLGAVSLGRGLRIERTLAEVLDVDWTSALDLLVLGRTGIEAPLAFSVNLLSLRVLEEVGGEELAKLSAMPGQSPCAVTSQQVLVCRDGVEWQVKNSSTSLLAFAG